MTKPGFSSQHNIATVDYHSQLGRNCRWQVSICCKCM